MGKISKKKSSLRVNTYTDTDTDTQTDRQTDRQTHTHTHMRARSRKHAEKQANLAMLKFSDKKSSSHNNAYGREQQQIPAKCLGSLFC